jgi:hypothetical protein
LAQDRAGNPEQHIRAWVQQFVVGLDLCPFARPLRNAGNLRITVCTGSEEDHLLRTFLQELDLLQASQEREIATTLLVFPHALADFEAYLVFFDKAQGLLIDSGLQEWVLRASFHPLYQFQGEDEDAASHFSNRAPYPVIHLLRESMLTRVLADYPHPERIPARNIEKLNRLGSAQLRRNWLALFKD